MTWFPLKQGSRSTGALPFQVKLTHPDGRTRKKHNSLYLPQIRLILKEPRIRPNFQVSRLQ